MAIRFKNLFKPETQQGFRSNELDAREISSEHVVLTLFCRLSEVEYKERTESGHQKTISKITPHSNELAILKAPAITPYFKRKAEKESLR